MSERDITPQTAHQVCESLVELAVNRFFEEANFDYRDYLTDEELRQYEEAQRLDTGEPATDVRAVGRVVIEVSGGVADVTSKPANIEVEIIDHDNEAEKGR